MSTQALDCLQTEAVDMLLRVLREELLKMGGLPRRARYLSTEDFRPLCKEMVERVSPIKLPLPIGLVRRSSHPCLLLKSAEIPFLEFGHNGQPIPEEIARKINTGCQIITWGDDTGKAMYAVVEEKMDGNVLKYVAIARVAHFNLHT